jgi:hypothetical protein
VERICREQRGNPLRQMATALVTTFLEAKLGDAKASVAFYSVSSDVDGAKVLKRTGTRFNQAIVEMLASSCEPLHKDPQLVATMLQAAMAGVSRRLLESEAPEQHFESYRRELILLASAYLASSTGDWKTSAASDR